MYIACSLNNKGCSPTLLPGVKGLSIDDRHYRCRRDLT